MRLPSAPCADADNARRRILALAVDTQQRLLHAVLGAAGTVRSTRATGGNRPSAASRVHASIGRMAAGRRVADAAITHPVEAR